MLKFAMVPAIGKHTATIFMIHGLGDSGHGWVPVAEQLSPALPHAKFILPHAPNSPVSLNGGAKMPSWFDLYSLDNTDPREDEKGVMQSIASIKQLVDAEIASGIPANRIVIGGFSQGCAVALAYSCIVEETHAGFLGLSGFLPIASKLEKTLKPANLKQPYMMCHGKADAVVQYGWGKQSFDKLKIMGFEKIVMKSYANMGHSSSNQEIEDVAVFLKSAIP